MHKCAAIDCSEQIDNSMLMCRDHWFLLPYAMRNKIYYLYNHRRRNFQASEKYLESVKRAQQYLQTIGA